MGQKIFSRILLMIGGVMEGDRASVSDCTQFKHCFFFYSE